MPVPWICHGKERFVSFSNWKDQCLTFEGLGCGFKHFWFSPRSLGNWSNLTSIFFRWVGSTTNYIRIVYLKLAFLHFLATQIWVMWIPTCVFFFWYGLMVQKSYEHQLRGWEYPMFWLGLIYNYIHKVVSRSSSIHEQYHAWDFCEPQVPQCSNKSPTASQVLENGPVEKTISKTEVVGSLILANWSGYCWWKKSGWFAGMYWTWLIIGINYQPQLVIAGFLQSTVWMIRLLFQL